MASTDDALQLLEAEVTNARSNTISANSQSSYLSSTTRFLQWMLKHKRDLVLDGFADSITFNASGEATKDSIKLALSSAPDNPPIDFSRITARDFMTWIVSLKKPNGAYNSFATYASHRSAFYNLFQDFHCVMSTELTREMSCHFKGLQHNVAAAISQGLGQIKVGKDPMAIGLYKKLAFEMLQNPSRDMVFGRMFMIMS
jgi:hypothetical protein